MKIFPSELDPIVETLKQTIDEKFIPSLVELLSAYEKEIEQSHSTIEKTTLSTVKPLDYKLPAHSLSIRIKDWFDWTIQEIKSFPKEIRVEQTEDRFQKMEDDSFFIRIKKWNKRMNRTIATLYVTLNNKVRVSLGKDSLENKKYYQEIAVQEFFEQEWTQFIERNLNEWITAFQVNIFERISVRQEKVIHSWIGKEDNENTEATSVKPSEEILERIISKIEEEKEKFIRIIHKVNTFEYKFPFKSDDQKNSIQGEIRNRCHTYSEIWGIKQNFLQSGLIHSYHLLCLAFEIHEREEKLLSNINGILEENIWSSLGQVKKVFEELEGQFDTLQEEEEVIISSIRSSLNESKRMVTKELLPTIQLISESNKIDRFIELFQTKILKLVDELPETITVYEKRSSFYTAEKSSRVEIPLQDSIRKLLLDQQIKYVTKLPDKIHALIDELVTQIQSTYSVLDLSLLSGLEALQNKNNDSVDAKHTSIVVVQQAYDRVNNQLTSIIDTKKKQWNEIVNSLKEKNKETLSVIEKTVIQYDFNDLKWKNRTLEFKSTAVDWQTRVTVLYARISDVSSLYARFVSTKAKEYEQKVRSATGFYKDSDPTKSDVIQLGDYLAELNHKIQSLPFIYRKVFNLDHQEDLRYYMGMEEEINACISQISQFKGGAKRAIAVVGEVGSGKSSFITKLTQSLEKNSTYTRIELPKTLCDVEQFEAWLAKELSLDISQQTLIEGLKSTKNKKLIILEGLHDMYLRSMNGFDVINYFQLILNETSQHIFWLVSVNRYTWEYLTKVSRIELLFTNIVETDKLSAVEMESILLKRHNSTGYQIVFEPDQSVQQYRSYKKLLADNEAQQQYLKELFIEQLYEKSNGNVFLAMIQWILSVKKFTELEVVLYVSTKKALTLPSQLNMDEIFTLAFFVLHGMSNAEDHAVVFEIKKVQSERILSRLEMLNLIVQNNQGSYRLNNLVYRPVIKELKNRNILY